MNKVKIADKLTLISTYWDPHIVGELNGQHVKLAKFKGEFIWHHHEKEDEMFLVVQGELKMEFRDRTEIVKENEFIIVPRGVEHRPVADSEVCVMLFEPSGTVNTGSEKSELTRHRLKNI